jgi:thiol peroxidase
VVVPLPRVVVAQLLVNFDVPVLPNGIRRRILQGLPYAAGAFLVNDYVTPGCCPSQLLLVAKIREQVDAWPEGNYAGAFAAFMPAPSKGRPYKLPKQPQPRTGKDFRGTASLGSGGPKVGITQRAEPLKLDPSPANLSGAQRDLRAVKISTPQNRKEDDMAAVKFRGQPVTLEGAEVGVGQKAPDFRVQKTDLGDFTLADGRGKVLVLVSVPSLDTPVCDQESRRFNEEAARLNGAQVVVISMDLPFAQKRWCGAAGVDRILTCSDHREASFGRAYGCLIKGGPLDRLLCRAVFVVDREGVLQYVEYVPEITEHPRYEAVLAAARKLL